MPLANILSDHLLRYLLLSVFVNSLQPAGSGQSEMHALPPTPEGDAQGDTIRPLMACYLLAQVDAWMCSVLSSFGPYMWVVCFLIGSGKSDKHAHDHTRRRRPGRHLTACYLLAQAAAYACVHENVDACYA